MILSQCQLAAQVCPTRTGTGVVTWCEGPIRVPFVSWLGYPPKSTWVLTAGHYAWGVVPPVIARMGATADMHCLWHDVRLSVTVLQAVQEDIYEVINKAADHRIKVVSGGGGDRHLAG